MDRWAIDIDRDDITRAQPAPDPELPLPAGAVEVAVELVALTANNITYAALGRPSGLLGEDAGYWDFFADRGAPGRLPVWGFATVTRTDVPELPEGEQLYGYWPLASHALLQPAHVTPAGFVDATPRRRPLPALYNRYQRVAGLDDHDPADHAYWPVFRPLHLTGWLIADQLADADDHGADQVLVTAASSKTSLAFAHSFRARDDRPELVALTSPSNVALLERIGYYDRIATYDAVSSLPRRPSVLVDVAGNAAVVRAVHERFGDDLRLSLVVGLAHWDAAADAGPLPGPRRTGFFAPARLELRATDWGPAGLRDRIGAAWRDFMRDARDLTRFDERHGGEAALAAYEDIVHGRADPAVSVLVRP